MATGVVTWSQTAATNASADTSINWAEGQAPSSVNDSARALMSSVAKWRDDIRGTITTGGTSTAYTVTTSQSFAALSAGLVVAFVPHTTNGATATLNVDSLGAKPLRYAPGSSFELGAGVLIQGVPYAATYYTSNSGEWIVHGFFGNPYNVPLGCVLPYCGSSAPNANFVLPYGQAISRTTYSAYFTQVGTSFGSGDGSTTFNVPDLRGRAIFGLDSMGGAQAARITNAGSGIVGTTLGATGGAESLTIAQSNLPNVTLSVSGTVSMTSILQLTSTSSAQVQSGFTYDMYPVGSLARQNNPAISGTTSALGSGTALSKMPPGIILYCILRVI